MCFLHSHSGLSLSCCIMYVLFKSHLIRWPWGFYELQVKFICLHFFWLYEYVLDSFQHMPSNYLLNVPAWGRGPLTAKIWLQIIGLLEMLWVLFLFWISFFIGIVINYNWDVTWFNLATPTVSVQLSTGHGISSRAAELALCCRTLQKLRNQPRLITTILAWWCHYYAPSFN